MSYLVYQWLFLRAVGQTLGTITTKLVRFVPWLLVKLVILILWWLFRLLVILVLWLLANSVMLLALALGSPSGINCSVKQVSSSANLRRFLLAGHCRLCI